MFKKILLATSLIILVISGCTSPKSLISTPRTFTVLYNDRKDAPFDSSWLILQEYQKRENVTLDVSLGDDADYNKAITLTLDSGNIPDIILKAFPDSTQSYASTGLLLPFSDYEKQMPNFMAYIKKQNLQGELDKLRLEDGKYYILPGFQRRIQVQQWIYRRDLFEKNGLPMPLDFNPRLVIDPNSIEAIRLINEKLDPYIAESTIKFIPGELSVEKDWNTYISTMDNLGHKTIKTFGMLPG